jgi:hypothetical protein
MAICSHTTTIFAARQAYITNDSLQINDVPYPQYSSDNRSALNPSEQNKTLNFFGCLKLCLQPDVSVTTNRSSRFKCLDVRVTANHAERLKPASFTVLYTCWAAVMSISHPLCEGGRWRKAGLPFFRKIILFTPILASSNDSFGDCYRWVGNAVFSLGQHAFHHLNCQTGGQPFQPTQLSPVIHWSTLLKQHWKGSSRYSD